MMGFAPAFSLVTADKSFQPILCAIDAERDCRVMDRDVVHAFTLRMNVFLQPKRQRDEQHAYDHGISADYPDQRQSARPRSQHHADSKQHRYYAAQNQEPLVVDLLAQLDRAYDLKYPGRDRPAGNEKQN